MVGMTGRVDLKTIGWDVQEMDPSGEHSNMNVGMRTGTFLFFPTRDNGNYIGKHRKLS